MDRLEHVLKFIKKPTSASRGRSAFVYLVGCHGFTKVGVAVDIELRLINLQVGNPYEVKLLASFPSNNAVRDEGRIHAKWKRYEIRGEWFFVPAGELASAMNADSIAQLIDELP